MSSKSIQRGPELIMPEHYSTVAELLIYISAVHSEKGITYISSSGDEQFESYPELLNQARMYLQGLRDQGIRQGQVVILEIDHSQEFYRTFWACMLGGIVVAPVSPPSAWEPGSAGLEKFTKVWEVLERPVVVAEEAYMPKYQQLADSAVFEGLSLISVNKLKASRNPAEACTTAPDDIVFLQFSSGSTGIPKGVQLTNHNIIANSIACKTFLGSEEGDNVFTWLPHTHDMGMFGQHLTPILSGANIMVMSPYTFVRSPYLFLRKITEHQGKWFCCTNFGFEWMVQKIPDSKLATLDLSSLRMTLNGAEPISTAVIERFVQKFGACGYRRDMMFPAYGMAEATVGVCTSYLGEEPRIERISRTKLVQEGLAVPVDFTESEPTDVIEFVHEGYPMTGIQIRIANEQGEVLDERVVGEIQIRGESVTSGYYHLPDLNREIFVDGWLRTGDLGFMAGGSLVVSGRIKDIVFIRGQNYYAHDLEEILYQNRSIPRGNLTVVGHFNSAKQVEEMLVFVKYKSVAPQFLEVRQDLIHRMRAELGIEITHVLPIKVIPKTTSGKVQRFMLRNEYECGAFDADIEVIEKLISQNRQQQQSEGIEPASLEQTVREAWAETLQLPLGQITTDASFLALGGNSILSYQLLDRLSALIGRELGQELLVFCRTVREMVEYLQELPAETEPSEQAVRADNHLNVHRAIAITGLALRLPDADTQEQFWNNLVQGLDSVERISADRAMRSKRPDWDDWIGELKHPDTFDHEFFDIPSEQAAFMDPQHRKLLEVSYEALEDAGMLVDQEDKRNVGVYVGINPSTYFDLVVDYMNQRDGKDVHSHAMVGNMSNIAAASISHLYNFTGPALAIDTACSSFLVALTQAAAAIQEKRISGAVVGGATILASPHVHQLSRHAGICSSTKHTKVFDREADGSVIGEGAVVVYLEPLTEAVRANKHIYGLIRGTAVNNDGYSLGIMAPNPQGQYEVLRSAYQDANLNPSEISYIEAHGSGTRIGDPIEVNALLRLFQEKGYDNTTSIGLGSVKTNIGHLFAASSGASLAKVLLSMQHAELAPSLHMDKPNPALRLEQSPFHIVSEHRSWDVPVGKTRKAGISSFGLGGTNAHIVLEEWKATVRAEGSGLVQLLTFSAKTEQALQKLIHNTKRFVSEHEDLHAADLCFTRNRYRKHYRYRAAVTVNSSEEWDLEGMQFGFKPRNRAARVTIVIDGHAALEATYWTSVIETLTRLVPSIQEVRGINAGEELVARLDHPQDPSSKLAKADIVIAIAADPSDQTAGLADCTGKEQWIHLSGMPSLGVEEQLASLLRQLYVLGAALDWEQLHPDGSGQIVHLPSHPFEPHVHWVDVNQGTEVMI
ncbi:AMP-binding protein [Paenibacillus sp. 11B]|uniref:beta-ketoacyl synthase N-terminal-like domain-containing protein n=1 Tax=Paenibacillus sp. 11B TaxID=3060965 RepID=UPI00264CEFCA|nr:beta-ketoacyl synthase N-terminal-like domain-containing protein [Paenibacillus sp. 11B]MDN8588543.1 AMP-binding protein [Paenibacillus sp. 11B]